MHPILDLAVCGLLLLHEFAAGSPVPRPKTPRYFRATALTRRHLNTETVASELGTVLSSGTLIFGPESPLYANATERWVTFVRPDIQIVVQPSKESDISNIVRYCNDNSIEYLVRGRGHGVSTSLNIFKGLQIGMDQLRGLEIQPDQGTVWLQGGSYAGPTVQTLWDHGYVTATGAANCVGLGGLGLGGGHGRLESLYGLVADGYVHLNVVLSDGSEIGVNATSHADLFWAMKGAGHNFGIVTSSRVRIYPRPTSLWHYHSYIWTGDKLEIVFDEINKLHMSDNGTTNPLMAFEAGLYGMNATISKTKPILFWSFVYNGPAKDAETLLQPFNAIGAVWEEIRDIPYIQVPEVSGTSENSSLCDSSASMLSNALLREYNITTQRRLYDLFVHKVTQYPELAAAASLAHEGYANKAVQVVPSDSTAYAHRAENNIVYFRAIVPEGSGLYEPAVAWAKEAFDIWTEGQDPKTYVNYVFGHPWETPESVYGQEPWRLHRLRKLKAKYDAKNSFRFFVPIVAE